MKNKLSFLSGLVLTLTLLGFSSAPVIQETNEKTTVIHIYRPQETMMSGGRALEVKFHLNDKEVAKILTGTRLTYKLHSVGKIKMKFVAEFGGGAVGAPFAETLEFEKGKEYHIWIGASSMKGVKGEILDSKGIKDMEEEEFFDEEEMEEDLEDPIIKETE